jgi:zinc-binding dehydrogenase
MFVFCGCFASFTYLRPFLEQTTHASPSWVSIVLLVFGLAYFAGNAFAPRMIQRDIRNALLKPPIFLVLISVGFLFFGSSLFATVILVFLWGAAFGATRAWFNSSFYEEATRIKDLTNGIGVDSVLECVGTQESMMQAIRCTRPGGAIGYVGVPHGVEFAGEKLFYTHVHLHGGPAPVRQYLPHLIDLALNRKINPGKVFGLALPLEQVAEGYRAMDERRGPRW